MFRTLLLLLCCSVSLAQSQESSPRTQYFPNTSDGIHLEMVFNYNLADLKNELGHVDMVWGANYPLQPPGVYNTAYIPYSVDNFTNTVAWYQQHHPDWLEYLCDRKTLAYEFGSTSLAPIDFSNAAVQAYQWRNWVDAPLAQGFDGIAVDTMSASANWGRCGHTPASWTIQPINTTNSNGKPRPTTMFTIIRRPRPCR
jgi:hypothetical protein